MSEKKREWTTELPSEGTYWVKIPGMEKPVLGIMRQEALLLTVRCTYSKSEMAQGFSFLPIETWSEDAVGSTLPRPLGSHARDTEQGGETLEERVIALESRLETDIAAGADIQVRVSAAESREQCRRILTDNFRPALREQVAASQKRIVALDEWRVEVIAEKKTYRLENNDRFNSGVEYANGLQERAETHDKCSEALESRVADLQSRLAQLEPTVWRLNGIEHDSAKTDPQKDQMDTVATGWSMSHRGEIKRDEKIEMMARQISFAEGEQSSLRSDVHMVEARLEQFIRAGADTAGRVAALDIIEEARDKNIQWLTERIEKLEEKDIARFKKKADAGQVLAWSPDLPTEPGLYWTTNSKGGRNSISVTSFEGVLKFAVHFETASQDWKPMNLLSGRGHTFCGPFVLPEEVPDAT